MTLAEKRRQKRTKRAKLKAAHGDACWAQREMSRRLRVAARSSNATSQEAQARR